MKVDPRFLTGDGPEIFTGSEQLIKGALETRGGVHLLGGYPGSPIAGFFDTLAVIKDLLNDKGIRCVINNNEALAAAMLNGCQTVGARGMIAMKSVGVHVAADALALGNLAGANPKGGAVVVYGDDPWSDSTQVAADSRYISKHLFIPTIEPATPQEVKDYVPISFELSAASELYAGYILTTNLADGGGTVQCRPNQFPEFNTRNKIDVVTSELDLDKYVLLPPRTWWQEESLADRQGRALAVARRTGLNRIDYPADGRKSVGFITSGLAHSYLVQTLWELGLLGDYPILKFGMTYPLDPDLIRELAGQCERIVVIEERRGFLEEQVNEVMGKDRQDGRETGLRDVWGKRFPKPLKGIPSTRGLHPSILIARLVPLLKQCEGAATLFGGGEASEALDREIETMEAAERADVGSLPTRIPTFCPGCPHRDSAAVCLEIRRRFSDADYMRRTHKRGPADLIFHGDIGCYTMLMFPPNAELMHNLSGMGLGGGTGSGVDPFVTNKQVVFMGDSTFFHCGQIAISNAIKLGQDITFILLDNSTTGMTGHQPTPGNDYDVLGNLTPTQNIEDFVRGMTAGQDVLLVRANPEHRKPYIDLLEHAFLADGVKVVIADKECGITRMRRKRRADRAISRQLGYLPRLEHMNINPEVCRFCLACVEDTGCPGLRHVETDYGRKMDTDLTWCVDDGACERIGACSAFEHVTIKRKATPRSRVPELGLDEIPEPRKRPPGDLWRCCITGVGGMGIGLATSIVTRAGHKEGYDVIFVDKKGLAIRNGGVVSQVVYNISRQPITALIPYGKADLLIGMDILEAARAMDPKGRTRIASPERTAAVINTDKINTINGIMGRDDFDVDALERAIHASTRSDDYIARNISRICEKYLGSKLYANVMMLGFVFQKGLIPVSMHSIAWAIKDAIRSDFRKNLWAFNMGRKLCERMDIFQGPPQRTGWKETLEEKCRHTIRRYRKGQRLADSLRQLVAETVAAVDGLSERVKRALTVRAYDCMRWGGLDYARRYADRIRAVYDRDAAEMAYAATEAAVFNLANAMLIKDAVYISELSTSPEKYARDREKYNVNPANGDSISYRHLWRWRGRIAGREVDWRFRPRHWMLQALRGAKWLRKLLPNWHRGDRQFLQRYEELLDAFAYSSTEEYRTRLGALSSPQCMNCLHPRCLEAGCPLTNNIPQWTQLAYEDRWQEAAEALHETNNFPEFTARICPAFCQDACKKSFGGFAVKARQIEGQIVERAFAEGWVEPRPPARKTARRVAVVGSGPAGLAAAQQLGRAGHDVVVFEKDDKPGGLLRYGIPDHRLDKKLIDRRLRQLRFEGVEFRTGVTVGRDVTGEDLRTEYDAVLLATGAARSRDLDVEGCDSLGIHQAIDFLRQQNWIAAGGVVDDAKAIDVKDKAVVVIGGGLTGEDCVEAAVARGAREVHQFEILPQAEARVELAALKDEGDDVRRRWCVSTRRFEGNGQLERIEAIRVEWLPSARGPVMRELPGSAFKIEADVALLALGFDPHVPTDLAESLGLSVDAKGRVAVEDCATNVKGVFAAGDLVTGATYVVTAIDSGRKAAEKVDAYLARKSATTVTVQ